MPVNLPDKPRFMDACNRCGICCAIEICQAGRMIYHGATAPCPGLRIHPDGRGTYCELVAVEVAMNLPPRLQAALGIGIGCTMPDTADEDPNVILLPLSK